MNEKIHFKNLTENLPEEIAEIDLYQKREKIYTRKIEGKFQRIRVFTGWPLLFAYFFLPWLEWGERQAILFDLTARKFYIANLVFWPQDFPLLAWILIISAFALFLLTKLFGRVWCGYTCPQTVWTSMFMWIEQRTEGTRNQRIKLDKSPWSTSKITKKFIKHLLWFGLAFYTAFTFVAYFTPANDLIFSTYNFSMSAWALFWVGFFTVFTYLNAGFLREQVCMYMCPYARFQSAMFDPNTLTVSYDSKRGEARGSRKKNINPAEFNLGDCVDCQLCVQVCPTGIDIRDGLQHECIGCALCIDACNSIMDKMDYSRGLISYTTENRLNGNKDKTSLFLRADILGYFLAICFILALFSYSLYKRVPLELDIIRDRNQLYEKIDGKTIENNYTARLVNMTEQKQTFLLSIDNYSEAKIIGKSTLVLEPGELLEHPFRIRLKVIHIHSPVLPLVMSINSTNFEALKTSTETRFLSPGNAHYEN